MFVDDIMEHTIDKDLDKSLEKPGTGSE